MPSGAGAADRSNTSSGSGSEESFGEVVGNVVADSATESGPHPADAMWYVRPPSGDQYGPAETVRIEQWIAEGRISRDTYVWRDGWESWELAADAFPSAFGSGEVVMELGPSEPFDWPITSPAPRGLDAAASSTSALLGTTPRSGTKSSSVLVFSLIGLAVVAIALVVTLVLVL